MENKHVNAIVVGAGAGGGIVAKELAVNGFSVILFERGDWTTYDQGINDELISQRCQALDSIHGPDWKKNPRVHVFPDGRRVVVNPSKGGYGHIAACVGSGTVSYGAMAWRYMPEDFKLKTVYGSVEDSTLDDWPITYDDLEPYYEKAEWEIGVSGDETNPFAGPRKKTLSDAAFQIRPRSRISVQSLQTTWIAPFPDTDVA